MRMSVLCARWGVAVIVVEIERTPGSRFGLFDKDNPGDWTQYEMSLQHIVESG